MEDQKPAPTSGENAQQTGLTPRKTYSPPRLQDYGSVTEITLAKAMGGMGDGGTYPNIVTP